MAKGPENSFIASVHRLLPVGLYRIKNHNVYNGGQADVWYSGNKADLWIEYKFVMLPKRDDTVFDLGLSSLQQEWLRSRAQEGRNVAVVVGCKEGGAYLPGTTWDKTHTPLIFRKLLRSRKEIADKITAFCNTMDPP